MTAVAFDTLAVARRLKAAGFSDEQAEAMTGVIREAGESDVSLLASKTDLETHSLILKADIDALRQSNRSDLREVELRLEARIESSRADTIKWVLSAIGFQTVVIVGAIVALSRVLG